jgi:hypothetical protein
MEDTAKIMVDLAEDPEADTGEWELLQHPFMKTVPPARPSHFMEKLEVIGTKIEPPRNFKPKKREAED